MNVLEQMAIRSMEARSGRRFDRKAFRQSLLAVALPECDCDEDREAIERDSRGILPDAYLISQDERVLHLIEVEDTSKLTVQKLLRLYDLAWALDRIAWEVAVHVTDRYGKSHQTLTSTYLIQFEHEHRRCLADRRPA